MNYLKTMGKSNGIFSHSLKSDFEVRLANLYILARKSNGFGVEIEYAVVKDACVDDVLEAYETLKSLNQKVIS